MKRPFLFYFLALVALIFAPPAAHAMPYHDIDTDPDYLVTIDELLRGIQFYNSLEIHCEQGTEDGFAVGPGDRSCAPHESDYAPQDWSVSLDELLRLIQFYNTPGYHPCDDPESEDGYCPGVEGVLVSDPALNAAIRSALNQPSGPLEPESLATLTVLQVPSSGIISIAGLEACTGLVELDLHDNCIVDISPLAPLTQLESLNLDANAIVDIAPLAGLSQLRLLWLGHNRIEDTDPLVENVGLGNTPAGTWDRLAIAFNPLSALDALGNLEDLRARGVVVWDEPRATNATCESPLQPGDPVPIGLTAIHSNPETGADSAYVILVMGDAFTEEQLDDPGILVEDVPDGGYSSAEKTWAKCAADTFKFFFSEEPFTEYAEYFKVYRLDLISTEGVLSDNREDPPVVHDTALGMANESLAFSFNDAQVRRLADATGLPWDRIVLMPNAIGSGKNISDITMFSNARTSRTMTALHELGHGIGGLTDEYEYKHGTNPPASEEPGTRAFPNAIATGDTIPELSDIPWAHWLLPACNDAALGVAVDFECLTEACQCGDAETAVDCIPLPTCEPGGNFVDGEGRIYGRAAWPEPSEDTPVGLYEGAWFRTKGAYRPELRCRMRSDDDVEPGGQETTHFCKVCREALTLAILADTGIVERAVPGPEYPQFFPPESGLVFQVLDRAFANPSHRVMATWEVDGVQQPLQSPAYFFDASDYSPGSTHELAVTVYDPSPFVHPDNAAGQEALHQRITWTINILE